MSRRKVREVTIIVFGLLLGVLAGWTYLSLSHGYAEVAEFQRLTR